MLNICQIFVEISEEIRYFIKMCPLVLPIVKLTDFIILFRCAYLVADITNYCLLCIEIIGSSN